MLKHLTLCFYTLIIFCVVSCNSGNPAKLWFYTHSLGDIERSNSSLTPASFLYLQKDGSYTKDFGVFEYGHWTKKDDKLLLTNSNNTATTIEVKYAGATDLQLVMDKNTIANFEAQPSSFTSNQVDPFTLVNNKWRQPATHKENEQEIRKRLRNHCQFWEAYFTWALDNKIDYIDVRSTPTPIKIYGNGFGLKPFNELPAAWRSYFFDVEDCKIANNLLYEVFKTHLLY